MTLRRSTRRGSRWPRWRKLRQFTPIAFEPAEPQPSLSRPSANHARAALRELTALARLTDSIGDVAQVDRRRTGWPLDANGAGPASRERGFIAVKRHLVATHGHSDASRMLTNQMAPTWSRLIVAGSSSEYLSRQTSSERELEKWATDNWTTQQPRRAREHVARRQSAAASANLPRDRSKGPLWRANAPLCLRKINKTV